MDMYEQLSIFWDSYETDVVKEYPKEMPRENLKQKKTLKKVLRLIRTKKVLLPTN